MFGMSRNPTAAYRQVGNETTAVEADPHRLILMLFDGALASIAIARLRMQQNNVPEKGAAISKAIDIVTNGLQASLNAEQGGELAERLGALYDYISHRLLWANLKNDIAALDEAAHLLGELHSAWSAIATEKTDNAATKEAL
ncbi:flagellar export chaperone FliS [uncultured Propionivibrio sp.]|uniref:flagellar export chaperone FliS n=1 Tax=uncultured Propionivibrio sp. TaxID=426737 RepID=UPI0029C087B6|nr:flagellar export chaperone FliS [uncultured Propionivibrio sp.]